MIRPRILGFAAAMSVFLAPALADVPPAMDRVPADAALVISVKNISKLKAGIDSLAKSLGVPAADMEGLMKVGEVLNMQGADANGSAAMGVMSTDGDQAEGVAIIPVRDYAAFVKNFGATGAGVEEIKLDEKPMFVKNVEGGFAAVSSNKTIVEKFGGKPGNGKSHEALMGATGKAIAESSDIFIVANIGKMGDQIKEGATAFKDQMAMGMAMMGNAAGGDLGGLDKFVDGFVRDASAGIIGFRISDAGVTLDAGAQFKEGSEFGSYFAAKGNASKLLAKLPNQPFLFAMAMDTSSPGIRKIIKDLQAFGKAMQPEGQDAGGPNMLPTDFLDKADGMAFQLGNSPAPMGGLFLNTVAFMQTTKPGELAKMMKDQMVAQNGKTISGTTFTTAYEQGVKAGELTADAWSLKMQGDPEDPQAQMLNQVNFMLFGPGGLNGYTVQTEGGLVMTYSKNSDLLGQAVASSKGGENMSADADVKKISDSLPAGRSFEGYIGVKSLLDTAFGLLAPMGVLPQVDIPEQVPPVGMGATTEASGFRFTLVVPTGVITAVKSIADAMDQGGGGDDMDKGAGQPKF